MMKHMLTVAFRCCTSIPKPCDGVLHPYVNKYLAYSTESNDNEKSRQASKKGARWKKPGVEEAHKESPALEKENPYVNKYHAYSTESNDNEKFRRASKKGERWKKPGVEEAHKESPALEKEKYSKALRISTKKNWIVHDKNNLLKSEMIGGQKLESLANEVASHFHPNEADISGRRKTQTDMKSRLNSMHGNTKKKNKIISTDELLREFTKLAKEKYEPKPHSELDTNKISKYVDVLLNSKERLNLFDSDSNLFSEDDVEHLEYKTAIDWWDEWEAELDKTRYKSHYQEILEWTKEGKFPTLPVDNEIGMEEEQDTPFHKHVFLHGMLDDGIPKQGPVRKFMESVILGLSNNPYLTVKEKEEHVTWFKDYFKEKYDLLKTLGTIGDENAVAIDGK